MRPKHHCRLRKFTVFTYFTVAVYNISLQPSSDPFLILIEGSTTEITCEVNQNAAPPPTIFWYLNNITVGTNKTINKMGNRTDNGKTLECRASNNNTPPKTARTTLNVECK